MDKTLLYRNRKPIIATVVFFVAFVVFSLSRSSFQAVDTAVNLWATTIHTDLATLLAKALSTIFDTIIVVAASLVIATFLFIKKT